MDFFPLKRQNAGGGARLIMFLLGRQKKLNGKKGKGKKKGGKVMV